MASSDCRVPENALRGLIGIMFHLTIFECIIMGLRFTLHWKKHTSLLPVFTSSGHHGDGVVCVTLEVSEGGLSCCWVPELQGGLTTSLSMVGHSGGVEAAGS